MEDSVEQRSAQIPSNESATKPPFTILGWDLYLTAFVAIAGAIVLFGIYWIFFSSLPMPTFCGAGYRNASICGWVDRSGRQTPAPWVDRPKSVGALDRPAPPS